MMIVMSGENAEVREEGSVAGSEGGRTVREYVVEDYRTASVFQKYGLDFCCGGGAALEKACNRKGISIEAVLSDLAAITAIPTRSESRYTSWPLPFLATYIRVNHHDWVRSVVPTIREHAAKVARVHGGGNPALARVDALFANLAESLLEHMKEEEELLFPAIDRTLSEGASHRDLGRVISEMESEHAEAGELLRQIRSLTNDFTPPDDACMTYRVLFQELEEFEEDLHRHVHLENNILFPRALAAAGSMN